MRKEAFIARRFNKDFDEFKEKVKQRNPQTEIRSWSQSFYLDH
ncbi:MAG: hypothetical protein ACI8XB_003247 [Patiriisocius sp.]|jgi:hypothetical protein